MSRCNNGDDWLNYLDCSEFIVFYFSISYPFYSGEKKNNKFIFKGTCLRHTFFTLDKFYRSAFGPSQRVLFAIC